MTASRFKREEDTQDNSTGNRHVAHVKCPTPTIQFLTKQPGPVRINANTSGMWAGRTGMPGYWIQFLYSWASTIRYNIGWRQHTRRGDWGGLDSVKLVPAYPTPQGWQFSNFVSGSCRGRCQETPWCTQHRGVCIICSEHQPACQAAVQCAASAGPVHS